MEFALGFSFEIAVKCQPSCSSGLNMPVVGTPSLDQLQVLIAVVDEGSFAAAGRRLNRATSAISYSVASLETQLGLELFDRTNARRPKLTNAGETVLAKARSVATGVD